MCTPSEFRKKALGYGDLAKTAVGPEQKLRFKALERSFTELANNEEWLANNHDKTVRAAEEQGELASALEEVDASLAEEEEQILRCLGAALIMQWKTLPRDLGQEISDNAGSMSELIKTPELRRQIARFLHKRKDEKENGEA